MGGDRARDSRSDPLQVDFVPPEALGTSGRLGMTLAPGKNADGERRDLEADLRRLKETFDAGVLVSLMESSEYEELRIPDLLRKAEERGMEVLHLPIPDGGVPPEDPETDEYGNLIWDIARCLKMGQTVVVHCRGGSGRSGMVVASVLVALGHPAVKALEIVRRSRKSAVETPEQEEHVHFFEMSFGSDSARDV